MKKENHQLTSSRKVGMRDINALLSAPISRIGCCPQGRDDKGRSGFTARFVTPTLRAAIYAGYSGRTGFTLIELLVVVLIIGILAAVALPQYQKAVWKARITPVLTFISNVEKAGQMYVLEHGYPPTNESIPLLGANSPLPLDLFSPSACNEDGYCEDDYFTYYAEVYNNEGNPQFGWTVHLKEDPVDSYWTGTIFADGTSEYDCSYAVLNGKTVCELLDSLQPNKYRINNAMD